MKKVMLCLLPCLLLWGGIAFSQDRPQPDPENARIVVSDIQNFWRAYDQSTEASCAEAMQREYLDRGSIGLKDFVRLRISSASNLASRINRAPGYYASIRESTLRVESLEPRIRAAFHGLKNVYPKAVFPTVYFVIGLLSTGGTVSDRGLLIGAEMYAKTGTTPLSELSAWQSAVIRPVDDIPAIVAHELVHYQQKLGTGGTVLAECLREGSADFVAELISGKNINEHLKAYGVGYKITQAFYERAGQESRDRRHSEYPRLQEVPGR